MIAGAGLAVVRRETLTLTPADVRVLWAEYSDDGHVLARAFLDRYLPSGPSEAIVVGGDNAFEKARQFGENGQKHRQVAAQKVSRPNGRL